MSLYLHATLVFLGAILATIYLVPKVISIVKFKQLMDDPNERSSHAVATPSLGGIAFFIVFMSSPEIAIHKFYRYGKRKRL